MSATVEKITYTATPEQVARMHDAFDVSIAEAVAGFGKTYPMIVNGEERQGNGTFEVRAPHDRSILLGSFQKGTKGDVDDAVAAAKAAYPAWSGRPWQERVALLGKVAEIIRERKFNLASVLIIEAGKTRGEAMGEIEEGADLIDEYIRQTVAADGFVTPLETLNPFERNKSIFKPFGVWAVLAPFNFPHALSAGPISAALIAGNTVVYKPASATAYSGYLLAECFVAAGIPAGAFNFVTGGGAEVGGTLTHHPDVEGVIFTGSKEVGWELYKTFSTEYAKPCITEMGGKNPVIVTKNADIEKALDGTVRAAFGFSGQKCSAASRAYVERPVYEEFVSKLAERAKAFVVGDPIERTTGTGPVIDESAVDRFLEAVESAQGGTIRAGGVRLSGGIFDSGTYVAPTVVDGLGPDHELFHKELFLPLIAVAPFDTLDEAIGYANDTEYGLTAGIFSEDKAEQEQFFNTIEAGVVYANRRGGATTGAWPGSQAFCGWKGSGSTGKGALGPHYVAQFLREQSQTLWIED
jgi:1-pyrroline-5-carboxylate dehydrogenase